MSRIVVAGGGPAGAAAACVLARAGQDVLVLEREAGPHDKVCGDFLSVEARHSLAALGLNPATLGAGRIGALRLAHGAREAVTALPFTALGLSRRVLDAALLDHAAASGATVRRGVRALALRQDAGGGPVLDGSDGPIRARALFLATGKHELRGAARTLRPAQAARNVGLKMYWRLASEQRRALRGHVELVLFDGGYAGLLPVEGEMANLSLVVSAARLAREGGGWEGLLDGLCRVAPHLRARLRGATPLLPRPLAVSRIPYGFLHAPTPDDPPGVFRVGDQSAVIPSLTGDGVAIALHSGRLAARSFLAGEDPRAYHARLRAALGGQMRRAVGLAAMLGAPRAQGPLVLAARLLPGAMRLAASGTRIAAAAA